MKTDITYLDINQDKIVLASTIPFGVDVQSDVIFHDVDAKKNKDTNLLSSKVTSCYRDGCKVVVEISPNEREQILSAKNLVISFKAVGSNQSIDFKMSTKGIKKAFDLMKKNASKK